MKVEVDIQVTVGKIKLAPSRPGFVWLLWEGGEGMEVEESKLTECLEAFYREHF
jgi:hypothetical protein